MITFCESCVQPLQLNALQEAGRHGCLELHVTLRQLQLRDMWCDTVIMSVRHYESKLEYLFLFPQNIASSEFKKYKQ